MKANKKVYARQVGRSRVTVNGIVTTNLIDRDVEIFTNTYSYVSNPNYKRLIANGQDASSNYSAVYCNSVDTPSVTHSYVSSVGSADTYNTILPTVSVPTTIPTSLSNEVIGRFRSKVASESGSFNSLVPLAEAKDLSHLVASMASASTKFVKNWNDLRHGRSWDSLDKLKAIPAEFSDLWLTFNFGFSPMMSDAASIAKAIARRVEKPRPIRITASASSTEKLNVNKSYLQNYITYVATWGARSDSVTYRSRYTGGFAPSVKAGNNYLTASQQFGVTLPSLIPTAWALMPYSWLLDYFVNVGDVLEDNFLVLPNPVYLVRSDKIEVNSTLKLSAIPAGVASTAYKSYSTSLKDGGYVAGRFTRSKLTTIPVRSLSVRTDGSIGRNAISKLSNLIALLAK